MSEPRKTLYLTAEQIGSIISGLQRAIRRGNEAIAILEGAGDATIADTERSLIAGWQANIDTLRANGAWVHDKVA